jgi:hypothetical protein
MKYAIAAVAAVAVVAAIAGGALAQTTGAPGGVPGATPAAPVAAPATPAPPSTCPAYPAVIANPDAATLRSVKQVDAHTTKLMEWRGQYQAVHDCRLAEIKSLEAAREARVGEARTGQSTAIAAINSWQGTIDAFTQKAKGKKK